MKHAPLSEERLSQAYEATPRGELGPGFGCRVMTQLDSPARVRFRFSRAAMIGSWVLLAAASVAVMASVDWRAIEADARVATIAAGGLLLCLSALALLLRLARARFMEFLWRTLLD